MNQQVQQQPQSKSVEEKKTVNKRTSGKLNKSTLRTNWDLHTSSKYGTIISSQDYID